MKKPQHTAHRERKRDARPVPGGQDASNDDKIGEASEESFPASDAPAFTATTGSIANGADANPPKRRR
jgi:hypothetical protein